MWDPPLSLLTKSLDVFGFCCIGCNHVFADRSINKTVLSCNSTMFALKGSIKVSTAMIKSYKQINLCVALYQESDSGLKLSPAGSLLDFMSSVFGESPTATTTNHKTCGHVLGCGLNTVRRLLASPSFLLHLSVSSSSSFLSSV